MKTTKSFKKVDQKTKKISKQFKDYFKKGVKNDGKKI